MIEPLFPGDIVALAGNRSLIGTILLTYDDIDSHLEFDLSELSDVSRGPGVSALSHRQFKKDGVPPKGTVSVEWWNSVEHWLRSKSHQLVSIDLVQLLVRDLLPGDVVKRNLADAQSGVVIETYTEYDLQPLCELKHQSGKTLLGFLPGHPSHPIDCRTGTLSIVPETRPLVLINVSSDELERLNDRSILSDACPGDLLVYNDWLGAFADCEYMVSVKLLDDCVVEIRSDVCEHLVHPNETPTIGTIIETRKGVLRNGKWILGCYNANTPPVGVVVGIRPSRLQVDWSQKRIGSSEAEPPSALMDAEWDSSGFQLYDKTRKPPKPFENTCQRSRTNGTISNSELELELGSRVRFRDLDAACTKYNNQKNPSAIMRHDRKDNLGYDLNVFEVVEFRTKVKVQWQDLSISLLDSTDLVQDPGLDDEHAAWPGEIAHTLTTQAVPELQHTERPEKVGVIQQVNAAARMATVKWCGDSYVEYLGRTENPQPDEVVIYQISRIEEAIEDVSLYDLDMPGQINIRRGDIMLINNPELNPRGVETERDPTWVGEVVDTLLDGAIIVRLGAARTVQDIVLARHETAVAFRSDESDANHTLAAEDYIPSVSEVLQMTWRQESVDSDSSTWDDGVRYQDENGTFFNPNDADNDMWISADDDDDDDDDDGNENGSRGNTAGDDIDQEMAGDSSPSSYSRPTLLAAAPEVDCSFPTANSPATESLDRPPSYLVIDALVPSDHHFSRQTGTVSAAHMKRLQKEHKVLGGTASLPEGVFVRTWESRMDLLRVLIFGPTETPYTYAPFIVDIYMDSSFPKEPPKVFFHSWPSERISGSIGRCNPNLYEDGTICLSLLGTWDGNPGESWSSKSSTILQIIVSILGLVLVREPYFNEAGYETLVGTEGSRIPSAMYTERVLLRSKGLIITALVALASGKGVKAIRGLETLESILDWAYRDCNGPKFVHATIQEISSVLLRSAGSRTPDGLTIVSQGACIPLRRVLEKLTTLLDDGAASVPIGRDDAQDDHVA